MDTSLNRNTDNQDGLTQKTDGNASTKDACSVKWREIVEEFEGITNADRDGLDRKSSIFCRRREGPPPLLKHNVDLYLRYLKNLAKLEEIYNSMTHPQKREHIKGTQSLIIKRVLQLRNYFYRNPYWQKPTSVSSAEKLYSSGKSYSKAETWEYVDVNSEAFNAEARFDWHVTQTQIPRFIRDDCKVIKEERNSRLKQCIRRSQSHSEEDENVNVREDPVSNTRIHAPTDLDLGDYTVSEMKAIQNKSATSIQRFVRGYLIRLQSERNARWIKIFIGMMDDSLEGKIRNSNMERLVELDERRDYEKQRNEVDYKDTLSDLCDEIHRDEGFAIKRELRAQRIEWVTKTIAETNQIPESLEEFYESDTHNPSGCESTIQHGKMEAILYKAINDHIVKFKTLWAGVETSQYTERFSIPLAKDLVIRDQVKLQIQKLVDQELMTNLKRINDLDASNKKAKNSVEKTKKSKPGKSKKGKKDKGLPGDKFIELKNMSNNQMMDNLVKYGVLDSPQEISMNDLVCSSEPEIGTDVDEKYQPIPTLSETKRLVIEYGILPISTREIRKDLDDTCRIRSILLFGPRGCGKTKMAKAMAHELGALFVDLSPRKIPEEILDLKGGPTKLLHTVFTLAKNEINAPIVIFIGECEKYFQQIKKKKATSIFASKFQKELLIYKNQGIQNERLIIVGSSSCPWNADLKQLKWKGSSGKPEKQGFFEHYIYVPMPGYADRSLLWRSFVEMITSKYKSISRPLVLNYELLSRFSKGYSTRNIKETVDNVLTLEQLHEPDTIFIFEELLKELHSKEALQSDEEYTKIAVQFQTSGKSSKGGKGNKGKKAKK